MKSGVALFVALFSVSLAAQSLWGQAILTEWGDRRIIPDERVGPLKLGTIRDEIVREHGGPIRTLMNWDYPKPLGPLDTWMDSRGFRAGFCSSNRRMFVLYVRKPSISLSLPEGISTKDGLPTFIRIYGQPREIPIPRYDDSILVFTSGFVGTHTFWAVGAFNPQFCDQGGSLSGAYIPFVGRSNIGEVFFSKTGSEPKDEIGVPILTKSHSPPKYGMKEWIFAGMELMAPTAAVGRVVPFGRKFVYLGPDSRIAWQSIPRAIPDDRRVRLVAALGLVFERIPGSWRVEFVVGKDPATAWTFASAEFEIVNADVAD